MDKEKEKEIMPWRSLIFPSNKYEAVLFCFDMVGITVSVIWGVVLDISSLATDYILIMTAISITISVGVKIFNLITSNKDNKEI